MTILRLRSGQALGSTSATHNPATQAVAQQWYKPYDESRYATGTLPTDYRFIGQRSEEATPGSPYDYGARFMSPAIGRFLSPDTMVPSPGDPQSLNRYAYARNNPLRFTDPTGHNATCGAFTANPIAYVGCEIVTDGPQVLQQIESLAVQHGPSVIQALLQMADKLPALVDWAGQAVDSSQQTVSRAGNTIQVGWTRTNGAGGCHVR